LKKITTIYRIQIEPFNIVQKAIFHYKKIYSERQRLMEKERRKGGRKRKHCLCICMYERATEGRNEKVSSRASPLPLNMGHDVWENECTDFNCMSQ
jgi:hypothetical protein